MSLLRLVFLHVVSALSDPSLIVKRFLFPSFLSCYWSCFISALMLCKPGSYFLFRNNVFQVGLWGKQRRYPWIGSWMEWNNISNYVENIRIFITPKNSGCFINVYQTNPISWKQRNVQVVNTAKSGSLVWQLPMPLAIKWLCFLLVKQKIKGVLKTLRNFPADIDHKEKAVCCFIWRIVFYLKNGWEM